MTTGYDARISRVELESEDPSSVLLSFRANLSLLVQVELHTRPGTAHGRTLQYLTQRWNVWESVGPRSHQPFRAKPTVPTRRGAA